MTDEELIALKQEYNALADEGGELYEKVTGIANRLNAIAEIMRDADPDAAIECLFSGRMRIDA